MKFLLNVKIGVEHTIEYTNDLTSKIITLPELVKVDTGGSYHSQIGVLYGNYPSFNKIDFISINDFKRYCLKYGLSFDRFRCGGAQLVGEWMSNPRVNSHKYFRHVILAVREIEIQKIVKVGIVRGSPFSTKLSINL